MKLNTHFSTEHQIREQHTTAKTAEIEIRIPFRPQHRFQNDQKVRGCLEQAQSCKTLKVFLFLFI